MIPDRNKNGEAVRGLARLLCGIADGTAVAPAKSEYDAENATEQFAASLLLGGKLASTPRGAKHSTEYVPGEVMWLAWQALMCPLPPLWRIATNKVGTRIFVHERGLHPPQLVHPLLGYFAALAAIVLLAGEYVAGEQVEEAGCEEGWYAEACKARERIVADAQAAADGWVFLESQIRPTWRQAATGWTSYTDPAAAPKHLLRVLSKLEMWLMGHAPPAGSVGQKSAVMELPVHRRLPKLASWRAGSEGAASDVVGSHDEAVATGEAETPSTSTGSGCTASDSAGSGEERLMVGSGTFPTPRTDSTSGQSTDEGAKVMIEPVKSRCPWFSISSPASSPASSPRSQDGSRRRLEILDSEFRVTGVPSPPAAWMASSRDRTASSSMHRERGSGGVIIPTGANLEEAYGFDGFHGVGGTASSSSRIVGASGPGEQQEVQAPKEAEAPTFPGPVSMEFVEGASGQERLVNSILPNGVAECLYSSPPAQPQLQLRLGSKGELAGEGDGVQANAVGQELLVDAALSCVATEHAHFPHRAVAQFQLHIESEGEVPGVSGGGSTNAEAGAAGILACAGDTVAVDTARYVSALGLQDRDCLRVSTGEFTCFAVQRGQMSARGARSSAHADSSTAHAGAECQGNGTRQRKCGRRRPHSHAPASNSGEAFDQRKGCAGKRRATVGPALQGRLMAAGFATAAPSQ